ncbi:MAG: M23 family metallopeptidase [Clostridiales bacterium]|nr:M23 family metallopeptidase [Clostridiales bacterium]
MIYKQRRQNIGRSRLQYRNTKRVNINKIKTRQISGSMRKAIIAFIIFMTIFILKSVDRPLAQRLIGSVRTAITREFALQNLFGELNMVKKYLPKIQDVFTTDKDDLTEVTSQLDLYLAMPAAGKVIERFQETEGLSIQGEGEMEIVSAADGRVISILKHDSDYIITIEHSEDLVTVYHNISTPYVVKAEDVKIGQPIGIIQDPKDERPTLHFKVWNRKKPVDPEILMQVFESSAI